jgi:hypothetical protein
LNKSSPLLQGDDAFVSPIVKPISSLEGWEAEGTYFCEHFGACVLINAIIII